MIDEGIIEVEEYLRKRYIEAEEKFSDASKTYRQVIEEYTETMRKIMQGKRFELVKHAVPSESGEYFVTHVVEKKNS